LALIFTVAVLGILFAGCVQTSAPQACAGIEAGKAAACVYEQAVLEQNPFYCYSIADIQLRQACMRGASDPVVKKQLENSKRRGGQPSQQIPAGAAKPPPSAPTQPAASCDAMNGTAKDECIRAQSMADADLLGCVGISDQSIRMACVSQVAQSTRDVEFCVNLQDKELRDLCRLYAKGETPSSP
jgi:hypothetical protein